METSDFSEASHLLASIGSRSGPLLDLDKFRRYDTLAAKWYFGTCF
jgi:hypothetical protein